MRQHLSPRPLLSALLLFLSLLSPSFCGMELTKAPADFNSACVARHNDQVPMEQMVLLDSNYYLSLSHPPGGGQAGWSNEMNQWALVNNGDTCINSAAVCGVNVSNATLTSTALITQSIVPTGATDPVYLTVDYTCLGCADCVLNVSIATGSSVTESVTFSCSGSGVMQVHEISPQPTLEFTLQLVVSRFPDSSSDNCLTVNRVRLYYYANCPQTVLNLVTLQSTAPNVSFDYASSCVSNAERAGVSTMAVCNRTGQWEDSAQFPILCNCSAGYEPDSNLLTCQACSDNFYMSGGVCRSCPANSGRMTGDNGSLCTCNVGYILPSGSTITSSDDCSACAENFFNTTSMCMTCPSNSVRPLGVGSDARCSCNTGFSTTTGETTTAGSGCDQCATGYSVPQCTQCTENYYRSNGQCLSCPYNSGRAAGQPETQCTCGIGYSTRSGAVNTNKDDCNTCAEGYAENDMNICSLVKVRFNQSSYTFSEPAEKGTLNIEAIPPPNTDITLDFSSNNNDITFESNNLKLTSGTPSGTIIINFPFDSVALQSPLTGDISFTSGVFQATQNTASVVIRDDVAVTVGFSSPDFKVPEGEGKGTFRVMLSHSVVPEVKVKITGRVSNVNNSEVSAPSLGTLEKTVVFPPGEGLSKQVEFDVNDDSKGGENDEQYRLTMTLLEPTDDRLSLGIKTAFVFIEDDDQPSEAEAFPLSAIIGVCAGGAVIAVIAALFCILCLCIWRYNINRRGFYPTYEDKESAPTMLRYSASLRSISSQTVVVPDGRSAMQKENEYFV